MSFGEQIRLRRSELRLTRVELAERLGVSPSAVSNFCSYPAAFLKHYSILSSFFPLNYKIVRGKQW